MTGHPWRHDDREYLTDPQRVELFMEKGGRCHKCTRKIGVGEKWIAEHLNALSTGGTNEKPNWEVTCRNCFPVKNAEDATKAAKIRHVAVSIYLPSDQKRGPAMVGSKRSKWKHKMSGRWEQR